MKNTIFAPPRNVSGIAPVLPHFKQRFLFVVVAFLFAGLPDMYAQQRVEVTGLSMSNIDKLAEGIDAWLSDPEHASILASHANPDETGVIHSTANFLPWHRIHIRELEEHLMEEYMENPADNFDLSATGGVLPRWKPAASAGESNPIPVQLRVTYEGANGVANPDPVSAITPAEILTPAACTFYVEPADFSNQLQGEYHDLTHGYVGGAFGPTATSATVLGFWPWHAWVDEFWYNWESSCTAGYTRYPAPNSEEIIINSTVTWSGQEYVKGKVIIEAGEGLTSHRALLYISEARIMSLSKHRFR